MRFDYIVGFIYNLIWGMGKRWLRYGLIGNLSIYGVGVGFMAYLGTSLFTKAGSSTILEKIRAPRWISNWQKNFLLSATQN